MKFPLFGMMLVGAAAISGCSSTPQQASSEKPAGADQTAAASTASVNTEAATAAAAADAGIAKVVYFAYDSSQLSAETRNKLTASAKYLAKNPKASVRIEGNTDERGTREYNLALGDRRANAVRDLFKVEGVNAARIKTVSYGKERPVAACHDESCWQQNRRVELVVSGS